MRNALKLKSFSHSHFFCYFKIVTIKIFTFQNVTRRMLCLKSGRKYCKLKQQNVCFLFKDVSINCIHPLLTLSASKVGVRWKVTWGDVMSRVSRLGNNLYENIILDNIKGKSVNVCHNWWFVWPLCTFSDVFCWVVLCKDFKISAGIILTKYFHFSIKCLCSWNVNNGITQCYRVEKRNPNNGRGMGKVLYSPEYITSQFL